MGKPQLGDIGTKIRYNAGESLADQTLLQLKYIKPDGTTGVWTATVYSTNYAQYTTLTTSDLDIAGLWSLQIYMESPGWNGHSEIKTFEVLSNIS